MSSLSPHLPLPSTAAYSGDTIYKMLKKNASQLIVATLTGPKVQRKVAAEYGITAASLRVLLAISVVCGEYDTSVPTSTLTAAKLAATTRLREQVRLLRLAKLITRRRRYGKYQLSLTTTGHAAVKAYTVVACRAVDAFLHLE